MKKILLILIIGISLIAFAYADLGCCFDSSTGLCTMQAERSTCLTDFYETTGCSIARCDQGCCILADTARMTTERECQVTSEAYGLETNFQITDEASCYDLARSKEMGACVYEQEYENDCKFVTREECASDNFYTGALCSNESLNTRCEKTSKTMCEDNDVYYVDDCGNRDAKKSDCNYDSGTICAKVNGEHICKSLNCGDKQNGESWCVDTIGTGYVAPSGTSFFEIEDTHLVGSRYFKQYCLDGNIETEACADFRQEICEAGECVQNDYETCLEAGNDSEMCSEDSCEYFQGGATHCVWSGTSGYCTMGEDTSKWYSASFSEGGFNFNGGSKEVPLSKEQISSAGLSNYGAKSNLMLEELGLGLCVPLNPAGSEFWTYSGKDESSDCDLGDFSATTSLLWDSGMSFWQIMPIDEKEYGNAGLIDLNSNGWTEWKTNRWRPMNDNPLLDIKGASKISSLESDSVDFIIPSLESRCMKLGDCGGKTNYIMGTGTGLTSSVFSCHKTGSDTGECTLTFNCEPFKAPAGGDYCSQCGEDGLDCSEYRCLSLGKKCEFFEPEEADKGYCVSSTDNTGPQIIYANSVPANPVEPYMPIELTIRTDEASECKFNFNNAGSKYSDMKYDFGDSFGFEHKVSLTLPGQTPEDGETAYDILYGDLRKDLNHKVYVRCLDAAGNGEIASPYVMDIQVMKTPDKIPPAIKKFSPVSGSAIIYNSSRKEISFTLNEPAECKWSQYDKRFEDMENEFSCDMQIREIVAGEDYKCTGTLNNITTNISMQTRFYIKCKDQPWIEGHETDLYKRNTNERSFEYVLMPSEELKILEISPSGKLKKGGSLNITLKAITSGGALSGKSNCAWKISDKQDLGNSSFVSFLRTDSNLHTQTITSPFVGENYVSVRCIDLAGNRVYKNSSFNIELDKLSPAILRIIYAANSLKIKTEEESMCYYSTDKKKSCSFDITEGNITAMSGSEKEHTANWEFDETYYIKCKDYFGNYDKGCGKIIRTT